MARMTRAQREWRPGMKKKRGSIKRMFAATVLSLESLVAFFATLATFGMHYTDPVSVKIWIWVLGLGLAVLLLLTSGMLKKPWAYTLGWVLQALLIFSGFALTPMFFIGTCFALAYWYAVSTGARLDRENIQRVREQEEWERRNTATEG